MKRYDIANQVKCVIDDLGKRASGLEDGDITRTGYRDLDTMIRGFKKGELILVAGRPSMGKTSFELNLINHIAVKCNQNTLLISEECNTSTMVSWLLSISSRVETTKLRSAKLDDIEWDAIIDAAEEVSKSSLVVRDDCYDLESIKHTIKKINKVKPLSVVFIDYLQLIGLSEEGLTREEEIKIIMKSLKKLAKELQISIVVLSQLSRRVERRKDHRPTINDFEVLKKSLKYADKILMLYRDEYYNKDTELRGLMEVHAVKNNSGPLGCAELVWIKENCILADLDFFKECENDSFFAQ